MTDEIIKALVRPLKWEEVASDYHSGATPMFRPIIVKRHWKGHWIVVQSTNGYTEFFAGGKFGTSAAAKAAAEADYRARMAAALDLTVVERLVEALNEISSTKANLSRSEDYQRGWTDARFKMRGIADAALAAIKETPK